MNGQSSIDSLKSSLKKATDASSTKVDLLNELGFEYWIIDPQQSISYGKNALKISEDIQYSIGKAKALRVMGVAYWALGDPRPALENLTNAKTQFKAIEDKEGVANCTLNMGMVYADINEIEKAETLYHEAIRKFEAIQLKGRVATTYTKLGALYLDKKMYADALTYLSGALAIHSEEKFDYGISEAHNRLGDLYLNTNDLEQAEFHIRQSLIVGNKVNDEDGQISNLILLGKLQNLRGNPELGKIHLQSALKKANTKNLNNYKLSTYRELKEVMRNMGKLDSSLYYYDRFVALKDSIYSGTATKQIAALEFENQLKEKDLELKYLNEKRETDSYIKWMLVVGIWLVALLAFFLIKSLFQRNKHHKQLLASQAYLAKTERENQHLKATELQQKLAYKNKELTSYALNFVQKNELLQTLKEKIKEIRATTIPAQQQLGLQQLEKTLKQHTNTEKDWEDFRFHFEQVHEQFFLKLKEKHPSLSANDLKIASLVRLNLSIKEMAGIIGISPESAKTARYRLRKKLQLHPKTDLFDYLFQIDLTSEGN